MQPNASSLLAGKHIVVTRPQEDSQLGEAGFEVRLMAWGAQVSRIPLVEISWQPVSWKPDRQYDWIFFTSKNAVRAFYQSTLPVFPELQSAQIAVVGPATAEVAAAHGGSVAFVSPRYDAQSAAEAFCQTIGANESSILWPCGNLANQHLSQTLLQAGASVTPLIVYETRLRETLSPLEQACFENPVDLLAFTSPSAVQAFVGLQQTLPVVEQATTNALIACLGPKTVQAAIQALGRAEIQPESYTLDGLAQAIHHFYSSLEGNC